MRTRMAAPQQQLQPPWLHSAGAPHKRLYASVSNSSGDPASLLPGAAAAQQQQQPQLWGAAPAPPATEGMPLHAWESQLSAKRFRGEGSRTFASPAFAVSPVGGTPPPVRAEYVRPAVGAQTAAAGLSCLPTPSAGSAAVGAPDPAVAAALPAAGAAAAAPAQIPPVMPANAQGAAAGLPAGAAAAAPSPGDQAGAYMSKNSDYYWKYGQVQQPASAAAASSPGGAYNADAAAPLHLRRPCDGTATVNLSQHQQQEAMQKQQSQKQQQKEQLQQQQLQMLQGQSEQATSLLPSRPRSDKECLAIMPFAAGVGSLNSGMATASEARGENHVDERSARHRREGPPAAPGPAGAATSKGVRFRALTDLLRDKEIQAVLRMHAGDPTEVLKAAAAAGEDFVVIAEALRRRCLQTSVLPSDGASLPGSLQQRREEEEEGEGQQQQAEAVEERCRQQQTQRRSEEEQQQEADRVVKADGVFLAEREMQSMEQNSSRSGDAAGAGFDTAAAEEALMVDSGDDETAVMETEGSMKSRLDGE